MGDGGEVGGAPLVEVGDELEGQIWEFVTVCGQDKGAGGGESQRGAVEGPEHATT